MDDELPDMDYESRGLGDTLEKVFRKSGLTNALGKENCTKCKKRIHRLNNMIPYGSATDD